MKVKATLRVIFITLPDGYVHWADLLIPQVCRGIVQRTKTCPQPFLPPLSFLLLPLFFYLTASTCFSV